MKVKRLSQLGEKMGGRVISLLVAGLCMIGLAQAQTESGTEYTLEAGDVVEINVLEDPGLNRRALVRPDGMISMPLAGTIEVAGRTPEAVQELIRNRLSGHFLQLPTVTVSLVAVSTPESLPAFYVLGEVANPGRYTFDEERPVTVLQALSIAGGLGVFAARKRIQIRRHAEGAETLVQYFDYNAIESGKPLDAPILLEDGDVIVVPERGLF